MSSDKEVVYGSIQILWKSDSLSFAHLLPLCRLELALSVRNLFCDVAEIHGILL